MLVRRAVPPASAAAMLARRGVWLAGRPAAACDARRGIMLTAAAAVHCQQQLRRTGAANHGGSSSSSRRQLATVVQDPTRDEVLKKVKGQTLRIPDLEKLFVGWPEHINQHRDSVTGAVDEILKRHTVSPQILAKLTKNKLDLLVATWFPFATAERLGELSYFVCWMFILDDEIDSMADASVPAFTHLWDEVLRVIAESCGLQGNDPHAAHKAADFASAETFRDFGTFLNKGYTVEQRQRFWDELKETADSYILEHKFAKHNKLPEYDDYCQSRYGSSCMAQILSMIEYSNGSHLPQEIMESPELRTLWKETTNLLWINNDIVSFKKEIAQDFTENLVLIASKPSYDVQTGLDHCVDRMTKATQKVDSAASALQSKFIVPGQTSEDVKRDLEAFITNCRAISYGTYTWSRNTPRYAMIHSLRAEDGSISFTIGEPATVTAA